MGENRAENQRRCHLDQLRLKHAEAAQQRRVGRGCSRGYPRREADPRPCVRRWAPEGRSRTPATSQSSGSAASPADRRRVRGQRRVIYPLCTGDTELPGKPGGTRIGSWDES